MPENKVQIVIEAINKATEVLTGIAKSLEPLGKTLKEVQGRMDETGQASSRLSKFLISLKNDWMGLSLGINAVLDILSKVKRYATAIYDFVKEGQKVVLVETAFRRMAESVGADADAMIFKLKEITKGVMDDTDLMKSATEMMLAGAKPTQIERLTEAMAKLAPYAGMTLPEGMERLATALETGNARTIRSITGYIDLNYELEVYSQRLGKTADQLTDTARVQATAEILLDRFTKKTKDLKDTGDLGINTFLRFETAWNNFVENIKKGLGPLGETLKLLARLLETVNKITEWFATQRRAREQFARTPEGAALLGMGPEGALGFETAFQEWMEEQKKLEGKAAAAAVPGRRKPGEPPFKGATPLERLQAELLAVQSINDEEEKRYRSLELQLKIIGLQTKGITDQQLATIRINSLQKIWQEMTAPRIQMQMEEAIDTVKKRLEIEKAGIAERQLLNEQEWKANRKNQEDYLREKENLEAEGVALTFKFTALEKDIVEKGYGRLLELSQDALEKDKLRFDMKKKLGDLDQEQKLAEQKLLEIGIKGSAEKLALDKEIVRAVAEGQLRAMETQIARQRELNALRLERGEISPREAKTFELDAERALTQARIKQLEVERGIEESTARQIHLDSEILKLKKQLDDTEKRRLTLMEYQEDMTAGLIAGIKQYLHALKTYFQEGVELARESANAMQDAMGTLFFDAMQGRLKKAVEYWRMFANSVMKIMSDMLARKAMAELVGYGQATGQISGGLIGLIAGYWGAGGGTTNIPISGGETFGGMTYAFHKGRAPGENSPYRIVPSDAFIGARRFHSGSAGKEVPAILRDDEWVFTPEQVRALARGQRSAGDIYITNNHFNIRTEDALSFRQFALRNKSVYADALRAAFKENHPARKGG